MKVGTAFIDLQARGDKLFSQITTAANAASLRAGRDLNAGVTQGLSGVSAAVARSGVQIGAMGNSVARTGEQIRSAGQRFQSWAAPAAAAASSMRPLVLGVTALGVGVVKTGMDFDTAMAKLIGVTGAPAREIAALEAKARELGATTKFSATQAADGMGFLAMAGMKTNEILAVTPRMLDLASAANMDLARTSDVVTNVMSGMGLGVDQAGRAVDVMAAAATRGNVDIEMLGQSFKYVGPVAKSFGMSLEEAAASMAVLGDNGIQADMAGTALRGMLTRLNDTSGKAQKIAKKYGIELSDQNGKFIGLTASVNEFAKAGVTTSDVMTAFGQRAGPAFLALMGDASREKLNRLNGEMLKSEGAARRMAQAYEESAKGQLLTFLSAVQELGLKLWDGGLRDAFNGLMRGLTSLARWFGTLPNGVLQTVAAVAGLTVGLSGLLWTVGKAGGLLRGFGSTVVAGGAAVSRFGGAIAGGASGFARFRQGLTNSSSAFSAFGGTAGRAGQTVGRATRGMSAAVAASGGGFRGFFRVVGRGFVTAARTAVTQAVRIAGAVLTAMGPIGWAIAAIVAVVAAFKNWDKIKEWAAKAWSWIADLGKKIWEFAQRIPEYLAQAGDWIVRTVSEWGPKIWSWVKDAAAAAPLKLAQWSVALRAGLLAIGRRIGEFVADWAPRVWEWLKAAAAAAPGKLAQFGEWVRGGLASIGGRIAEWVGEWAPKAWDWLVKVRAEAPGKIAEWGRSIWDGLGRIADEIGDKLSEWHERIRSTLERAKPIIVAKIGEWKDAAIRKIREWAQSAPEAIGQFTQKLTDKLREWADKIPGIVQGWADRLVEWLKKLPETIKGWFAGGDAESAGKDGGRLTGGGIVEGAADGVRENRQSIVSALLDIGWELVKALAQVGMELAAQMPGIMFRLAGSLLSAGAQLVGTFTRVAFEAGWGFVRTLGEYLMGLPARIAGWLGGMVISAAEPLGRWVSEAARKAGEFVGRIVGWVTQLPGRIAGFLSRMASSAATTLSRWVSDAASKAGQFLSRVASYVGQLPGRIAGFLSRMASSAASTLGRWVSSGAQSASQFLSRVASYVAQLPGRILGILGRLPGMALNAGRNMISAMIRGINSMVGSLMSRASSIVRNVASKLNPANWFSPGSPVDWLEGADGGLVPPGPAPEVQAAPPVAYAAAGPSLVDAVGGVGSGLSRSVGAGLSAAMVAPLTALERSAKHRRNSAGERPVNNITVNANTNADAADIGRDVAWALRTSGR
ncbi:phage tail tape measure protein [Streptomyces sp. NPDC001941]|uniref:phage tail tape measure protein n=1 Tax=Streptomyces sp. NPDC001941 TaxID=3154659 RepID=UPI00331781F2